MKCLIVLRGKNTPRIAPRAKVSVPTPTNVHLLPHFEGHLESLEWMVERQPRLASESLRRRDMLKARSWRHETLNKVTFLSTFILHSNFQGPS